MKLEIDVSEEELEELNKCAKFNKLSLSDYCRMTMMLPVHGYESYMTDVWMNNEELEGDI